MSKPISVGLLGAGVVGSGVIKTFQEKAADIERQVGAKVIVTHALVRNKSKNRDFSCSDDFFVDSASEIINNPNVDIVVELMGGEEPAYEYIKGSLKSKKHVVTANKALVAESGIQLAKTAESNNVLFYLE